MYKQENVTRWFVMFKPWNKVVCIQPENSFFFTLYVGYCVQLGRFCPQEQHRVTQQLGKFHQSNTGLSQKQFQQVCLVDAVYKCFLRCINEWPLYLKIWDSINCTILCTWWQLAYNQAKANNYDIIIDHAHIWFVSKEKGAVGKFAKPEAVPPTARVSTSATANSNNSSNLMSLGIQKSLPAWEI